LREKGRNFKTLFCSVVAGFLLSSIASAQTVVVKILNGKNHKPLAHFRVFIVLGDPRNQHTLDLNTDKEGTIQFDADNAKTFQVKPIGTVSCGEQPIGAPDRDYSTEQVLKNGIVTRNDCGKFNPEPVRGQLLYLVRPATWLELFRN
jgi:hypothetical protein